MLLSDRINVILSDCISPNSNFESLFSRHVGRDLVEPFLFIDAATHTLPTVPSGSTNSTRMPAGLRATTI